jgi:hypothetical protein
MIVDNNLNLVIRTRQVAETAKFSKSRSMDTPDGLMMGTNTAYCLGYTKCPDWVNSI